MRHWDADWWMHEGEKPRHRYLYDTQWPELGPGFVNYRGGAGNDWLPAVRDLHCSKADVIRWCQARVYAGDRQ